MLKAHNKRLLNTNYTLQHWVNNLCLQDSIMTRAKFVRGKKGNWEKISCFFAFGGKGNFGKMPFLTKNLFCLCFNKAGKI
jgi:hypothetical protein